MHSPGRSRVHQAGAARVDDVVPLRRNENPKDFLVNRSAAAAVTVAALAVTACGSQHAATTPPSAAPTTATAAPASPSAAAAPAVTDGNITLSGQGRFLPAGPFTIKPLYCGPFTAAQKTQFGTSAAGGLIYTYTNTSNSLTGSAIVHADFTNGGAVAGDNVAGSLSPVGPGQSATGSVDAVGNGGQGLTFTGCELMQYAVQTISGNLPVSYAP